MVLDRLDSPPGVFRGVNVRHLHAHHTPVHQLTDRLERVDRRPRDWCHPCTLCGHHHQLDALQRDRPMFAVDKHPVEAQPSNDVDDVRRREHDRDPERGLSSK